MSKMAVKQWTCPNCFKKKKQVIELQMFNLNFREAMYMCMEKDCVFPLSDGSVIRNYIVQNVVLDIGESDLSGSEDDDNSSVDTNMKAEITSVSELDLKDITPENILKVPIPDTFCGKKYGMDQCLLVESHTLEGFHTTSTSCDDNRVQRQCADSLHTEGEESSNKNMGSAAVISKYDCVLEDLEIPVDEAKNTGFSSFDYETVFTNLVSELSAYAESTCESESKEKKVSERSARVCGTDDKNKGASQISTTYKSESRIGEEKNQTTNQVPCDHKSECGIKKVKNKNFENQIYDKNSETGIVKENEKNANQYSYTNKNESGIVKENEKNANQYSYTNKNESGIAKDSETHGDQVSSYKSECAVAKERNKSDAIKISDTCKSKCGITKNMNKINACEISNIPKGANDILVSSLTKNDLSNCKEISPSSDIEFTFKPPPRSKLQAETVICPIKEHDSAKEHVAVSDELCQDSKNHTEISSQRPYDSDLQSSNKDKPLNLIPQLEDADVQSCTKKRKLPLEDSATEFNSTPLLLRQSVRVKKVKCLENFYYY